MVADDERKVRNECGAAPWTRNERPVNDEDRQTNRGEEVSNGWLVGLLGHARETDPAPTVLIFYPFFYRFASRTPANVGTFGSAFVAFPAPIRDQRSARSGDGDEQAKKRVRR